MIERPLRKNLLLSATLEAGTLSAPVRIRNLSERGAMIDGPALPEVGSTFILRRLGVSIGATVVWNHGGRCGLKLDGVISIDDWVAGVARGERCSSLGQTRVDAIQAALRGGQQLADDDGFAPPTVPPGIDFDARIAAELGRVGEMLGCVADALTADIDVLSRHPQSLQNFDVAMQILDHLTTVVKAADRAAAVARLPMHDLRSRLLDVPTMK